MYSPIFTTTGVIAAASLLATLLGFSASAQQQPAGPSPAEVAIQYRKALYTLIGGNFRPIGNVLQGRARFDLDLLERAERTAFLATMVDDVFPSISKDGDTRVRPEVWSDPAGFAEASKAFVEASNELVAVLKKSNSDSPAFRKAAGNLGQACKNCHDNYRSK